MWLGGVGLAVVPVIYAVHCLIAGRATFPADGAGLEVHGSAATALAIAYMAVGVFMHVHWFWGLQPRLSVFSPVLRVVTFVVFFSSFSVAVYKILFE